MRLSRPSIRALPLSAALLFAPELEGQGWVTLPNGELGFITTLTTTGFFQCGDPFYMIGSCQVTANRSSLTLGSGGAFMTLTFLGLTQTILATSTVHPVYLGSVLKTFSGNEPFLFPTSKNINVPLFFFYMPMTVQGGSPLFGGGTLFGADTWGAGYLPLSRTRIPKSCCDFSDAMMWGISPAPAPYTYSSLAFDPFYGSTMTVTGEPMSIYANVGIAPEPATIWLTGTGLAVVAAVLRRRRKNSNPT